jgi:transglutaminase-like putative cysteine protease
MTMAPPAPASQPATPAPSAERPSVHQGPARPPSVPVGHPAANADLTATIALTALTLASTYGLHRLFAGSSWLAPVMVTGVVVHATAWACRRFALRPVASAVASVATVTLLVSWLVLPATTVYGIPLGETLRTAGHDLNQAWIDFKVVVAPAPATHGFVLATVVAVAAIALLADWAAFRMRATIESVVPAFTLFVFICALGTHVDRAGTVALEMAALLAFVVVHQVGLDRRSTAWFAGRTEGALAAASQVGAVLGALAVGVALILGPRLPGYGSAAALPVAHRSAGPGARSTISPLVDLRTRLVQNSGLPVMTVRASRPEYWRLTSLDTFDGVEWSSNESYSPVRAGHQLATDPAEPQVPTGTTVQQEFFIGPLDSLWLPAAYKPIKVDKAKGVSFSARSSSLIPATRTADGLSYQVTSVVIAPDLDATRLQAALAVPSDGSLDRYLRLPSVPKDVADLARSLVSGQRTEYGKALALEKFFQSPLFTYDANIVQGGDGNDALEAFLIRTHRGFCQQFAGAYAVLARLAGLPTRVAVGFTPGELQTDGQYHVRDEHAHAWPEVLFPGIGWVPFEPTPGRGIPDARQYTDVSPAQAGAGGATTTPSTLTVPTTVPSGATPNAKTAPHNEGQANSSKRHHGLLSGRLRALTAWLIGLMGAALLLLAGNLAGWRWWRAGRRRRAPTTSGQVLVAWADAADSLAWWGVERYPSETSFEFVRRVPLVLTLPHGPELDVTTALRELAVDTTAAQYSESDLEPPAAQRAAAAADRLKRALVASAGVGRRLRRLLDHRLLLGSVRRGTPRDEVETPEPEPESELRPVSMS